VGVHNQARKGLSHEQKPLHFMHSDRLHFLTLTALHWTPIFTTARNRPDTLLLAIIPNKPSLNLCAYVILKNHLHRLAQSPQLDQDIARFKSFTARSLITYLQENNVKTILDQLAFYKKAHKKNRPLQFWQEGSHPEPIQNKAMTRQKIEYIHHNPVKRGYVDMAEHWRYFSARNYAEAEGLINLCKLW
jgi:putative transposase